MHPLIVVLPARPHENTEINIRFGEVSLANGWILMAALMLQVWMYSLQDQDAGGCSVFPWLHLIRVQHCNVYFFCKAIYTRNCTSKDTKMAQLHHFNCERLKPWQGGICFSPYEVEVELALNSEWWGKVYLYFLRQLHLTDCWLVTGRTGRIPAIDTVPPAGLVCNNSGWQLWLPAQTESHESGSNDGSVPVL